MGEVADLLGFDYPNHFSRLFKKVTGKLWIFNADDGSLVEEKHYGSAQEVASQRFALPVGHYQILAASNLIEPFFTTDQTPSLTNWNNIQIGLTNPKDVEHNAYFGVADVKIDNKEGSYVVQNPMKSVLSELTVIIENVPKGTEMSGKALDCAWCLFPTLLPLHPESRKSKLVNGC